MKLQEWVIVFFVTLINSENVSSYKILGLFPYNGGSHITVFKSVMKGLARRGHTVHVVSHYPLETPLDNYTDLSILGSLPLPNNQMPFQAFDYASYDVFNLLGTVILYFKIDEHEAVMKTEVIQKLLTSEERYDLIITESFVTDMTLGFINKFRVPFIFLSSCSLPPWTSDFMANPQNPAFVPHFLSHFSPSMTFSERLRNTFGLVLNVVAWYTFFVPQNQKIMKTYFGDDTPPLLEIAKNVSLILANSHTLVTGSRPSAQTVIEIGGVHIEPPKKLPQDIEDFINNSPNGVIFFCLGSLLRAATLPVDKRNAFLNAFSQLNERVLWKFEDENPPTTGNVMIKKWMPQRDILAHPKVKLFISHGGLLGTLEAISAGKPILGMPMFGDQPSNIRTLESQGLAKYLDYQTIDNSSVLEALREILKPSYAERAKQVSEIFHDRPATPMETAVFWIEHVIRTKGAKHLRSTAIDLSFYQYLQLDVIIFSSVCMGVAVFLIYLIFISLVNRKRESTANNKKLN